jgi:hypothetical protein
MDELGLDDDERPLIADKVGLEGASELFLRIQTLIASFHNHGHRLACSYASQHRRYQ